MSSKPQLIPLACPNCLERRGIPIGLAMQGPDTVVAVLRCNNCAHMWQLQRRQGQNWPVASSSDVEFKHSQASRH